MFANLHPEDFYPNSPLMGTLIAVLVVGGWIIPVTAAIIGKNWRKARESEHMVLLKQSMIERGMSAEEIERVINAGMPGRKSSEKNSGWMHGQQQQQSLS
jgi:hypothetical protein